MGVGKIISMKGKDKVRRERGFYEDLALDWDVAWLALHYLIEGVESLHSKTNRTENSIFNNRLKNVVRDMKSVKTSLHLLGKVIESKI